MISFIRENDKENIFDNDTLREYLTLHIKYKTCSVMYDKDGDIIAISRWDIYGNTAHILNVIVRKDYRHKGILKELVKAGLDMFPHAKYIEFEREWRKDMKVRKYKIRRLM
jgi:ribosomal protein S18 acetylase RimI-like enzyme